MDASVAIITIIALMIVGSVPFVILVKYRRSIRQMEKERRKRNRQHLIDQGWISSRFGLIPPPPPRPVVKKKTDRKKKVDLGPQGPQK